MQEGLLLCGTCGRNPVGTQAQKGTHRCKLDCGMWVRNKPNVLIRIWQFLREK